MAVLQSLRRTGIDREMLLRSITDIAPTYRREVFQTLLNINIHRPDGPFSLGHNFQTDPNSVLNQVARLTDGAGNKQYNPFWNNFRMKSVNLWAVSMGGVWVLIAMQMIHNPLARPNHLIDGQRLGARLVVYDPTPGGREERARTIESRLPAILHHSDTALAPGAPFLYPFITVNVAPYDSGLVIHETMMRIIDNVEGWANAYSDSADIYATIQDIKADLITERPFSVTDGFPARARARILGNIQMGASLENQWKCISAIEIPGHSGDGKTDYEPSDMFDPVIVDDGSSPSDRMEE